jgi:tetratricopeptide (TPR) repeat protein
MRGPFARVVGALAVLLLYHGVLLRHPPAEDLAPGSAALDRTLVASRDAFVAEQFEDALAPTLALVEALPGQPVFLERLALVYQGLDRHGDEAGAWEAFVDASATPIDACPMLAEAYRRTGDEAAALDAYERCLAFDPKNVDMLLYLGQAYLRAGRHDAARRALRGAPAVRVSSSSTFSSWRPSAGVKSPCGSSEPGARDEPPQRLRLRPVDRLLVPDLRLRAARVSSLRL